MRADDPSKPKKAPSNNSSRKSRYRDKVRPLSRMKNALDKAQREYSEVFIELEAPEVKKGICEENQYKTEADTPLGMPTRDLLKILSH